MATTKRRKANSVDRVPLRDVVHNNGADFDFHALVRLLEVFRKDDGAAVGEGADPAKEAVRFRAMVSMEFPRSDVNQAVVSEKYKDLPARVETNFFGLAGLQGPLPTPYTQRVIDRMQEHDYSMRDFLDIFNHRLLSLLHRVRKTYWLGVSAAFPEETAIGQVLRAFIGQNSWLEDYVIPMRSLLAMAVCFWQRPRSHELLRMILNTFLCAPVVLELFEYGWRYIDDHHHSSIGRKGNFRVLGDDAVLGRRFLDTGYSFTIVVGPVNLERYNALLRGGALFQAIQNICHSFIGQNQQYRLNIVWSADARPEARLGAKAALGSTAWLRQWAGNVVADKQTIMTSIVREVR